MNTTHKIKAAAATLTVGFLLAIASAATAQAANGPSPGTIARAEATNRYYNLGVYSPRVTSVQRADEPPPGAHRPGKQP